MLTDCFMFLNTQNYKFRLQEVYFCKSSFLHYRIYIFVPHWFIFTLLTFTFFAVPFFSFTFVSAQKSKRIMCVIDQPARALYHHSIGKSDESQPEDTPHQQPPPSAATIIGEEVPKKNGRPLSGPTLSTVSTESRPPQPNSPGINTRTPDAEFSQQADRTPGTTPFRPHHRPIIHRAPERNAKAGPCPIDAADLSSAQPTPSTTVHPSPSKKITPAWKTAYERSWSTFISRRCSLQTNLP